MQEIENETDPQTGLPFDVVMDPNNALKFVVPPPLMNHAADALARAKAAYYKQWDTDKDNPVIRDGHMWHVELRKPE